MLDSSDDHTELLRIISTVTDDPAGSLSGDTRFEELGNWSSLAALRLLTAVEDHFQVRLNLRQYFRIETVDGLAAMITSSLSPQSS